MENQPGGWFSPLLPFVQCLRFGCRTFGDAHGIRSHGTDSPVPVLTAHPQSIRPHFGRRSWNPFPWNGFPYPHPYCAPSIYQTALRATLMESVHGTDSPIPAPTAPPLPVRPHSGRGAKEKTVPKDGLFMSGHWPRSIARPAGRASIFVLVDFRKAKIKKGISDSAESDSGLCPENPRPFEKGRRKLYCRLRAGIGANLSPSYFLGTRTSVPPIYGWSTFGMVTVPSAWRWFSRNAISIRGGATTVLFRV